MEGLRDRINVIRDHYRLSNRGFAEAIGAKPAATNNYLNGTKEPSLEFVDKILSTYIDVSADWLLRGKGTMFYEEDKPTDEALLKELAKQRSSCSYKRASPRSFVICSWRRTTER